VEVEVVVVVVVVIVLTKLPVFHADTDRGTFILGIDEG